MLRKIVFVVSFPTSFDWSQSDIHSSKKKQGKIIYPDKFVEKHLSDFKLGQALELSAQMKTLSMHGTRFQDFHTHMTDVICTSGRRKTRIKFTWQRTPEEDIQILSAYIKPRSRAIALR